MKHDVWQGQVFDRERIWRAFGLFVCACAMCLCTGMTAFDGTIVGY